MNTSLLTPELFAQYEAVINEYDRYRKLSPEEKEDLIINIATSTYIDLMSDWAFKHVFSHNKPNLLLLLNDFLPEEIVDIEYDPNEVDLWKGDDRKVIMDVLCHTVDGRRIIVEMQRADKEHFRSRMLFYGSAMIHTQLRKGDSYGKLMPVYVLCFMNFRLKHDTDKLVYRYQMREVSGELYGNQLNIILCELPRLATTPGKNRTPIEAWFDILQNMRNFAAKPELYGDRYDAIFESSRQSPIPEKERIQYFRSMFNEDLRSYLTDEDRQEIAEEAFNKGIDVGFEKGEEKGREKGLAEGYKETAKNMKQMGLPIETICQVTGLSMEAVEAL